tara:strand:- start:10759 stop:11295 length:537 start_codon:yes stop_codon:yes gene_type:complete
MTLSKEQKERLCDAKKKTSFSQRGSIELKSANSDKTFESLDIYFYVYKGEVIESALFERITRDCSGKLLRKEPIRRFRKVGSDEWFSLDASVGNDYWNNIFSTSSIDESVEQFLLNTAKKEKKKKLNNDLPPKEDESILNNVDLKGVSDNALGEKSKLGLKILAFTVVAVAIYKIGLK